MSPGLGSTRGCQPSLSVRCKAKVFCYIDRVVFWKLAHKYRTNVASLMRWWCKSSKLGQNKTWVLFGNNQPRQAQWRTPILVSSGITNRHRLNRGGDCAANSGLHIIAIGRLQTDARTQKYVAKRVVEGHSKMVALRCLKRYTSHEVYTRYEIKISRSTAPK
jgi:hypothetical protein